jgi:hypothetical protein
MNPLPKPGTKKPIDRPPDVLMLQKSRWYRASIAEVTWDAAQRLCLDAGGQLVSIEARAEGDLMAKLSHGRSLWLGATSDGTKWKWLSGAEMLYSNWASGEPGNATVEAHPLTTPTGTWRAATGKAGFICEWRE